MASGEVWPESAACRTGDPDALFVNGAEQNIAKKICRNCPVKYECLADALDNRIEFGVWGGMTERERRALLRRHPAVASWKRTFEVAAADQKEWLERQSARPELAVAAGQAATDFIRTDNPSGAFDSQIIPDGISAAENSNGEHLFLPSIHAPAENPVLSEQ